jgi:hypothetical protein
VREVMIYQQAIVMLREASDHGNRVRRNSNSIEELIAIRAAQEAAHNRNLFGAEFDDSRPPSRKITSRTAFFIPLSRTRPS